MTKFRLQKAPSAQNAVALIAETLEQTVDNILSFRDGGTPPSYEPTRALAPTLMEEGNLAWCLAQCDPIKWDLQKTINKELLHSLSGYRNLIEANGIGARQKFSMKATAYPCRYSLWVYGLTASSYSWTGCNRGNTRV